jgi:hypothetical protein
VGIVRSLNFKDQTVCVSWFKAGICPDEAREVECIDTISAYDLKLNYSPYYGDIVVRLVHSESTNNGASAALDGKKKKKKKKKIAAHVDLSWVGHVVNLPHGQVQVKWGDGSMSTVRTCIFFSTFSRTCNLVCIHTLPNELLHEILKIQLLFQGPTT